LFSGVLVPQPADLQLELIARVAALGYEVAECRVGGSHRRPLITLRIDRPGAAPGDGITVGECAAVSRALEPWLDALGLAEGRYVLEVSSPGLERPLRRPEEWRRAIGQAADVLIPGMNGRFRVRVVAAAEGPEPAVELEFPKGVRRTLKLSEIKEARLAFEW
jgi:ribosome maturation factor RimP